MKKADNFDAGKWLVENKITTQSKLNEAKVIDTKSNDFVQVRLYTPNDGNVIINKKAFVNYLTGKVSKEYKEELRDFIKYEFPDFLNNFEEELHDSSYEPFPSNQDVINQLEEALVISVLPDLMNFIIL